MVSVFGSLFNNIEVVKTDSAGKVLAKNKVPLAYGPRQKTLARLYEKNRDPGIAIKLPRISFEITDFNYDGASRINRNKKFIKVNVDDKTKVKSLGSPSVYKVGFELNIMSKTQDEALQILEQILPVFQPEYTVTIKDIPEMDITSDVPIVLTSVTANDDYEGDIPSRRTIIYTLAFETRIKYYRGLNESKVINYTDVYYKDSDSSQNIESQKIDGTTVPYTETIDFFNEP
jgi:hypothetical protein